MKFCDLREVPSEENTQNDSDNSEKNYDYDEENDYLSYFTFCSTIVHQTVHN